MARFSPVFLFMAVLAVCAFAAPTRPHRRQIGDLQCNLARLEVISNVSLAETLLTQINTTDLPTLTSIAIAQTGLQSVTAAVQSILSAVLMGDTAPADSRTQLERGLDLALAGVGNITSTETGANATASAVKERLLAAGQAGDVVLAGCK